VPTPAERRALLYLAGLLCLGAGVRAVGSVRGEPPPEATRAALARQIDAVDSARRAGKRPSARQRGGAGKGTAKRRAARDSARPPTSPAGCCSGADSSVPLDLDTASAAALAALPRIGPTLAKRIVEDRERRGPFGSLEGFQRVRGVGPAMARALAGRVTFSGTRRLTRAAFPPSGGTRDTGAP
jgi:competence protein ComEA